MVVILICLNVCITSVQSKVGGFLHMFSTNGLASHLDFILIFSNPQPFSSFLKIEAGVGSALIDLWAAAGQVTKMKGSIEQ